MKFAIKDRKIAALGRICINLAIEDRHREAYGLLSIQFWLLKGAIKVAYGDKIEINVGRSDLLVNSALRAISSALWVQIIILATFGRLS